jgi:F-type H+-transporting ATPase subunit epsilon
MAMTLHVDIVSAEAEIFSGTATMVFAPAEMGEVGIAPRHAPLLTRLKPGEVRIQNQDGQEEMFYVSGGMLEVQPHVVTVLADTAIRAHDLDEAQAQEAKERAEKLLADKAADIDYARAQAELAESVAQLAAIRKLREKR